MRRSPAESPSTGRIWQRSYTTGGLGSANASNAKDTDTSRLGVEQRNPPAVSAAVNTNPWNTNRTRTAHTPII